jgi:hypothetical protein
MNVRRTLGLGTWVLALQVAQGVLAASDREALIGTPTRVTVEPTDATLVGRRATRQLIATAAYADSTLRDLTRALEWVSLDSAVAVVSPEGQVIPKGNGTAAIVARGKSVAAQATVRVTGMDRPSPVSFRNDVIPAFSQASCNMGACHGTPTGKGGFKLSLRGYMPEQDFTVLSREAGGRRVNPLATDTSLILTKPLGGVFHEGGLRLFRNTKTYEYLHDWIAEGARDDLTVLAAVALEIWPSARVLNAPAASQQVVTVVRLADGTTYKNPAANYYRISRDPESAVETTAQLFLGVHIQCARCHNHPFERWTQDDYYGFAAFFSRVRQKKGQPADDEVIFSARDGEVRQPRTGRVMKPKALGGPVLDDPANPDRRVPLAAWLTGPDNPFFARCLVNRVWFHLLGRGIVEPVDDFRDSNPASNDELLDSLTAGFVKSGFDLKALIRSILTSRTYQLSAQTSGLNADDTLYFSHAYTKLLPAEVLLDAISTVTGTVTPFDGLPRGSRATQIPDSKIDNAFLKTFGRPARELACECERERDSNLSQALQLIGGATVNGKLGDAAGRMARLAASKATPEEITRELYLVALSRAPGASELSAAVKHLTGTPDRRQAVEDLGWVLINSKEFLFRH